MRKVSLAVIGSFTAVAIATSVSGGAFDVGGLAGSQPLTIVKEVDGDTTGLDPWEFTVESENCGASIEGPSGEAVEFRTVTIPAGGGSTTVRAQPAPTAIGASARCTYTVSEAPVDGWEAERGIFTGVGVPNTVTFQNVESTTTSSSSSSSTSTTSTSVASEPTATVDDSATTVAAATAQPQLPDTGSDTSMQLALIAGVALLMGVAATMAARRRPTS